MDDLDIFRDRQTYLEHCFKDIRDPSVVCDTCEVSAEDGGQCNECWYANVIIRPFKFIPECISCVRDTANLKNLLKLAKASKKKEIEMELNCCYSCLWFKWFDNKRKNLAEEYGITMTYKQKGVVKR